MSTCNVSGQFTSSPLPAPNPNTMSSPFAPPIIDIAALVNVLKPLIASKTATALTAAIPPAPPSPGPPLQQEPAGLTQTQAIALTFVRPLTSNQATSVSSHLLDEFLEVNEAVIIAMIIHQLHGSNLYKLDSKYCNKVDCTPLEHKNGAAPVKTDSSMKDYSNSDSVEHPLLMYFWILVVHCASTRNATTVNQLVLSPSSRFKQCRNDPLY